MDPRSHRAHFAATDTFSVSFFPCNSFDNKDTLFNGELHFSINVARLSTPLKRLTINATYAVTRSDHLTVRVYQRA
jgi:hypothetical protein